MMYTKTNEKTNTRLTVKEINHTDRFIFSKNIPLMTKRKRSRTFDISKQLIDKLIHLHMSF